MHTNLSCICLVLVLGFHLCRPLLTLVRFIEDTIPHPALLIGIAITSCWSYLTAWNAITTVVSHDLCRGSMMISV